MVLCFLWSGIVDCFVFGVFVFFFFFAFQGHTSGKRMFPG